MRLRVAWIALCALLLTFPASMAEENAGEDYYQEMPYYLRFTQTTTTERISRDHEMRRTYPDTMNDAVDAQMCTLIDEMAERSSALPAFTEAEEASLEVGAVISRSGTSVLSFLALAEVADEREQVSVEFASRVYDMETGKLLMLEDFFLPGSGVWDVLAGAVRAQLTAAFPGMEPDEQALSALCSAESLKSAPFSLSAARLTLTFRADAIYPGKHTLLHVRVPYADIRGEMNEYGLRQTDNSRFRMIALTFDDGPAGTYTTRVLDVLRQYGAQATFFVVGKNVARRHYQVAREYDSLHSVQSHTYTHSYPQELSGEEALEEKERFRSELVGVTGVEPTLMRAPGGREDFYIRHDIGYPLIHWSLTGKDSGNSNYSSISRWVIRNADSWDVVLMHDLNEYCWRYAGKALEHFTSQGILCVTVEELFLHTGVALEPNQVYYSPYHE